MSIEHNKAAAVAVLQAAGEHAHEIISSHMTEDATWWLNGSLEFSGAYPIAQLFVESAKMFSGAETPVKGTIGGITAEGDRVAVECRGDVRFPDGRVYANQVHMLFTFRGDRIASVKEYGDTEQLHRLFSGRFTLDRPPLTANAGA